MWDIFWVVLPKQWKFQLKTQNRLRLEQSLVKDTNLIEEQFIKWNETDCHCLKDLAVQEYDRNPPPEDGAAKQESRRKLLNSTWQHINLLDHAQSFS